MGNINLDNYEAFFLDYLEGNLADDSRRELAVFLNMHPELKEELDLDLEELTLEVETESFDAKSILKADASVVPITKANIEELIIAQIEGQLSAEQGQKVMEYVHANRLDRMMAAYEATILQMDESERFENKAGIRSAVVTILTEEINASNQEDFMIAYQEDVLTEPERLAVDQYVRKNGLEQSLAAFGKVQLQADLNEIFSEKSSLKKRIGFIIPLYARVASVAAIGLLLWGLSYDWNPVTNEIDGRESTELAESEDVEAGDKINREKPIGISEQDQEVIAYEQREPQRKIEQYQPSLKVDKEELMSNNEDLGPKVDPKDSINPDLPTHFQKEDLEPDDDEIVHLGPAKKEDKGPFIGITQREQNTLVADARDIRREEPVKVLTNLAGDVFKREVSFTRDKDVEANEYVAYGFKLGKFEFQRKKAR